MIKSNFVQMVDLFLKTIPGEEKESQYQNLNTEYGKLDSEKFADNYALEKLYQNINEISEIVSSYKPPLTGLWGRPIL